MCSYVSPRGVPSTETAKGGLSHGKLGGDFIVGHRDPGCDFGVSCEARILRAVAGYQLPYFLCIWSRVKALEHGKFLEVLWGRAGRVELEGPKPT